LSFFFKRAKSGLTSELIKKIKKKEKEKTRKGKENKTSTPFWITE